MRKKVKKVLIQLANFFPLFLGNVYPPMLFSTWWFLLADTYYENISKSLIIICSIQLILLMILYLFKHIQGWIPRSFQKGKRKGYYWICRSGFFSVIGFTLVRMLIGLNDPTMVYQVMIWGYFIAGCLEIWFMKTKQEKLG